MSVLPEPAELRDLCHARANAARTGVGQGRQNGPLRADYGPRWGELECDLCEASWVGRIDEPCSWCEKRVERQRVDQRRLLLHPDLPDRGDKRRDRALQAWATRLANAVNSGLMAESEARTAIARNR
jgi:hypothetical protein